jgi:hypothetical protein
MRILSFIIWSFLLYLIGSFSEESPHGKDFKISCSTCHSSTSWELDKKIYSFNHSATKMPLIGQHKEINCKLCHKSLVFSEAKSKTECVSCHMDIHSQTVGKNCDNCHTPNSWIVTNITEIHQQSRFPLVGVHSVKDCQKCHKSESLHRYEVLGVECVDCHKANYLSTTKPIHSSANFSTDCAQCHNIYSYEWGRTGFNHNFFPLTLGHSNINCTKCHTNNNYSNLSPDCYGCHKDDYNSATNPVHSSGCYATNCSSCHNTNPGWKPTSFNHENHFPISSGDHSGISCIECHTNPANCTFSCIDCHEHSQSSMNNEHNGESGYSWNSSACFNCHPRGQSDKKHSK